MTFRLVAATRDGVTQDKKGSQNILQIIRGKF